MSRAIAAHHGTFGRACLYELDRPMAMHAHREGHLVFHVSGPHPRMTVAGRTFVADPGVAAAISPLQPHDFGFERGGAPIVVLVLYIDVAWFARSGDNDERALRFGRPDLRLSLASRSTVRRVTSLLVDGGGSAELDMVVHALVEACRIASWNRPSRGPASELVGARDNRIRMSIDLMAQRVGEEISIDEIASDAGLSRPHFYRLFREHIGITPNVYLNTLRTERAIERLVSTDQAVTSIGLDLGFSSQASFTRFFRANVGIPPTDYRRAAHCA